MCQELIKGKKSFYAPYFAIADSNSFANWTHWDILALENVDLARLMKDQSEETE